MGEKINNETVTFEEVCGELNAGHRTGVVKDKRSTWIDMLKQEYDGIVGITAGTPEDLADIEQKKINITALLKKLGVEL